MSGTALLPADAERNGFIVNVLDLDAQCHRLAHVVAFFGRRPGGQQAMAGMRSPAGLDVQPLFDGFGCFDAEHLRRKIHRSVGVRIGVAGDGEHVTVKDYDEVWGGALRWDGTGALQVEVVSRVVVAHRMHRGAKRSVNRSARMISAPSLRRTRMPSPS